MQVVLYLSSFHKSHHIVILHKLLNVERYHVFEVAVHQYGQELVLYL